MEEEAQIKINVDVRAKYPPSGNKSTKNKRGGKGYNHSGVDFSCGFKLVLSMFRQFSKLALYDQQHKSGRLGCEIITFTEACTDVMSHESERLRDSPRFYHARTTLRIYICRELLNAHTRDYDFNVALNVSGTGRLNLNSDV